MLRFPGGRLPGGVDIDCRFSSLYARNPNTSFYLFTYFFHFRIFPGNTEQQVNRVSSVGERERPSGKAFDMRMARYTPDIWVENDRHAGVCARTRYHPTFATGRHVLEMRHIWGRFH